MSGCYVCGAPATATLAVGRGRRLVRSVRICALHVSPYTWTVEALASLKLGIVQRLHGRAVQGLPRIGVGLD